MSNVTKFRIGYENYVYQYPEDRVSVFRGSVIGGELASLRSKQLARQVTIDAESPSFIGIRWEGGDASDPVPRPVQLVALCNVYADKPLGGILRMTVKRYLASALIDEKTVEYFWWDSEPEGRAIFTPNVVCLFEEEALCDRVDIELQRSFADLTARIGPVWCGPIWAPHPDSGLEVGWSMTPTDLGVSRRTASGAAVARVRRVIRTFSGSLAVMPYSAAYGLEFDASDPVPLDVQKLQHMIGTTRLVYVLPKTRESNPPHFEHLYAMWRLGFVGQAVQLGRIVKQSGDWYRWEDFAFQEVQ